MIVIEGEVTEGRRLGRKLGFPTANVAIPNELDVQSGVYRSRVVVDGSDAYHAVTNVGVNPTVGVVKRRSESYLLDFNRDLYGSTIRVELVEYLRSEMIFANVDDLISQINSDVERVKSTL